MLVCECFVSELHNFSEVDTVQTFDHLKSCFFHTELCKALVFSFYMKIKDKL